MAERFFLDKGQPIKATPYLERLQSYIEANMPPESPCVLCGEDPTYTGAGMVDGVRIGYHLCSECLSPGWIERITAKVRGDMFLRRCN
jgi:hypothetical protein